MLGLARWTITGDKRTGLSHVCCISTEESHSCQHASTFQCDERLVRSKLGIRISRPACLPIPKPNIQCKRSTSFSILTYRTRSRDRNQMKSPIFKQILSIQREPRNHIPTTNPTKSVVDKSHLPIVAKKRLEER